MNTTLSLRVLLVEDNALIAMDAQDVLEVAGHSVVGPAAALKDALRLAEHAALDAAVLDVNLDEDQVWPVADVLRRRGVPFVFLTGSSAESEEYQAFAAAPFLSKPIDPERLLAAIARMNQAAKAAGDRNQP